MARDGGHEMSRIAGAAGLLSGEGAPAAYGDLDMRQKGGTPTHTTPQPARMSSNLLPRSPIDGSSRHDRGQTMATEPGIVKSNRPRGNARTTCRAHRIAVVLAAVFAVGCWLGASTSMAAGPSWSSPVKVFTEPSPGGYGLQSLSCPSASFCVAVDDEKSAVMFEGSSWGSALNIEGVFLKSVSCPSESFCAAVDLSRAIVYTAGTWHTPGSIDTGLTGGQLHSVSCSSESFCAAVDSGGKVVTYNGSSWDTPVEIDSHGLNAVSCTASGFRRFAQR